MSLIAFTIFALALFGFYLVGIIVRKYIDNKTKIEHSGLGTVEGSLLALFAFFLGFTFSISASKLETIRESSIVESNAVGTALLRTQLYNDTIQGQFENLFKDYLQTRLEYFKEKENKSEYDSLYNLSLAKSQKIWDYANGFSKDGKHVEQSRLMIPALNDMIDAVTTRDSDINSKLPQTIILTLYILSICSSFIVGFSNSSKILQNLVGIIYMIIIALTVNLIIDASDPRSGFINTFKANTYMEQTYDDLNK